MNDEAPNTPEDPSTESGPPPLPDPEPMDDQYSSEVEEQDAATQSLADALRFSFLGLKTVMVLLVVLYALSGGISVGEQERAIRVRLGQDKAVLDPGFHFGFPYPIDEHIVIQTQARDVELNDAFYYALDEGDEALNQSALANQIRDLNPEQDGSLLTADGGLVHARARVRYQITDAQLFVNSIGMAEVGTRNRNGQIIQDPMAQADNVVRSVLEQGLVTLASQISADRFIQSGVVVSSETESEGAELGEGQVSRQDVILQRMQTELDRMNSGIELVPNTFVVSERIVPPPVYPSYLEVFNAQSERIRVRSEAQEEAATILNTVAGAAHTPLLARIEAYEDARDLGNTEEAEGLLSELIAAFDELEVDGVPISGEAARIINQARAERSALVDRVQQDAELLRAFVEEEGYQQDPQLVWSRLATDSLSQVLSGELGLIEAFYMPRGSDLYVVVNSDPEIQRQAEEERIEQGIREREEAAAQAR